MGPLKIHFYRQAAPRSRDCSVGSVLTKLQEQILDSRRLAHRAKYKDVFSKSSCIPHTLRFSALASCFALPPASMQSSAGFLCTYVQDVLYAGFAGRLYGCSRLITSGTSYLAKTGQEKITIFRGPLMLANYYSILKLVILYLILATILTGCLGSGGEKITTKYYLIDPVESGALSLVSAKPLAIEIIDVHIPQYLERFQIATRAGGNRLKFSESNQWGENLRKNLMRTLSRNLSRLLSVQDIGTPLNRSSSLADYRVQIYIEQFERDVDSKVKLSVRWQISGRESSEPLSFHSQEMVSPVIEEDDYDQMVTLMRQLFGELSSKIAESILAEVSK